LSAIMICSISSLSGGRSSSITTQDKCYLILNVKSYHVASSLWWWRQYAPMKRRYASTSLKGAISQKTIIVILAAVRTWNLTSPNMY
jgi:hypothetical protein